MAITNHPWLNLNESRRYPLDDSATGTDDAGVNFSDAILVDCQLRWPTTYGQYAYLGGVTVTDKIVTLLFLAANTVDDPANYLPLAAVTVTKPLRPTAYAVTPLQSGVAGFVALGPCLEACALRFSTPRQGLLMPRIAQPYRVDGVTSLAKAGVVTQLTGLVNFLAGPDIEITQELLSIGGELRQALVARLAAATASRNTLAAYAGPCGVRPESRTCPAPGIETINGVAPDCDGNIEIVFENLTNYVYADCGSEGAGIIIEQGIGIEDVCAGRRYTTRPGQDDCDGVIVSSSSLSYGLSYPGYPQDDFDSLSGGPASLSVDDTWTIRGGDFDESEQAIDPSTQNVATYNIAGAAINRTLAVSLRFTDPVVPARGGLVLNWRHPFSQPFPTYFAAYLDQHAGKLSILRFNGEAFVVEAEALLGAAAIIGHYYRITAEVTDAGGGNIALDVRVDGVTDPGWPTTSIATTSSRYLPSDGYVGIGTDRCYADFSNFVIE
jgi:hypothetical protein